MDCKPRDAHEFPQERRGLRSETQPAQGEIVELAPFSAWHVSSSKDGRRIVCDTHLPDIGLRLVDPRSGGHKPLCYPGASNQGYQWRQPAPLRADKDTPGWKTMVETAVGETAYGPQWSHPHPSFSLDGRLVAYTSDATGWPQCYIVEVPEQDVSSSELTQGGG